MTTGRCTGCGACCDPVALDHAYERDDLLRLADLVAQGEDIPTSSTAVGHPRTLHWLLFELTPRDDGTFECRNFDRASRRCTVYESRPGVCAGFPWYGRAPVADLLTGRLAQCGYAVDAPAG